jgi:hypothetical protein
VCRAALAPDDEHHATDDREYHQHRDEDAGAGYGQGMAMFVTILKRDRIRNGMTEAQLARRLGVRWPTTVPSRPETSPRPSPCIRRTVKLFGWPEAFVAPGGKIPYR